MTRASRVRGRATSLACTLALVWLLPAAMGETACYTTSAPEVTLTDASGVIGGDVYVDNDGVPLACWIVWWGECPLLSVWIYQETNGIPGLQRDDEVHSDVAGCDDRVAGDHVVF